MSDSFGSGDSPQEGAAVGKSVRISEDPDSKAHLEALFEVINTAPGGAAKGGKPMIEREGLPNSFFNASSAAREHLKHRLGPSISVGHPSAVAIQHHRSISLPANIHHSHGRQYSLDSALPPGWEMAKTPDGLAYFIE